MKTLIFLVSIWVYAQVGLVFATDNVEVEGSKDSQKINSIITNAQNIEDALASNFHSISPHKPNYLLPFTYYTPPNSMPFDVEGGELNNNEMKFQLSVKVMLWHLSWSRKTKVYFAYTNQSYWQAYNSAISSPFRETNHEPEVFVTHPLSYAWGGFNLREVSGSFVHQSNGRGIGLSRSWNRVYLDFLFDTEGWLFHFKPWYRIPEKKKESLVDPVGDDNPDIEKYLGNFELYGVHEYGKNSFDFMWRNNLQRKNRGAIQLGWQFPITDQLDGYLQIFNGYGESLVDYDHSLTRIGFGIAISNWL